MLESGAAEVAAEPHRLAGPLELAAHELGFAVAGGSRWEVGDDGGCPIGRLIHPRDYMTAIEGVPVRYIDKPATMVPAYMDAGVTALRKALLKARVNIYDPTTVDLLSCLQNVHDAFGVWEWRERLASIARQFSLSTVRLEKHAA